MKVNNKNMRAAPNVGAESLNVEYTYQGHTSTKLVKKAIGLRYHRQVTTITGLGATEC